MKRQKIRKLLLLISLLLFPVTLYYFSPALIMDAGLKGIINGSFVVFAMMFLCSVLFGRVFCSYFCPAGGIQECAFAINGTPPRQGWKNYMKYIIWGIWMIAVAVCYFQNDGIAAVDFFFETEHGISVTSMQSYIIYYGILCLVLIPSLLFGRRVFCHYFCWMAPFMVCGTKLRRLLHLPGLHIRVKGKESCVSCRKCNSVCPMGIDVVHEVKHGSIKNLECIQCGACVDGCPQKILSYGMAERKENRNGNGKEA